MSAHSQVIGEERHVPEEDAADQRILTGSQGLAAVMHDPVHHLSQADGPVSGAEHVRGLRGGQPHGPAEEPAADDPVVRRVPLEEERLPGRKARNPPPPGR